MRQRYLEGGRPRGARRVVALAAGVRNTPTLASHSAPLNLLILSSRPTRLASPPPFPRSASRQPLPAFTLPYILFLLSSPHPFRLFLVFGPVPAILARLLAPSPLSHHVAFTLFFFSPFSFSSVPSPPAILLLSASLASIPLRQHDRFHPVTKGVHACPTRRRLPEQQPAVQLQSRPTMCPHSPVSKIAVSFVEVVVAVEQALMLDEPPLLVPLSPLRTKTACAFVTCNGTSKSGGGGVNSGAIAGPIVAVLILLSLGVWWWLRRKKVRRVCGVPCENASCGEVDLGPPPLDDAWLASVLTLFLSFLLPTLSLAFFLQARDLARLEELEARARRAEKAQAETLSLANRSAGGSLHQRRPSAGGDGGHSPTFPEAALGDAPYEADANGRTLRTYSSASINLDPSHPSNRSRAPAGDPFSDAASVATSNDGLSFLSQSTNVIPIAFVSMHRPRPSSLQSVDLTVFWCARSRAPALQAGQSRPLNLPTVAFPTGPPVLRSSSLASTVVGSLKWPIPALEFPPRGPMHPRSRLTRRLARVWRHPSRPLTQLRSPSTPRPLPLSALAPPSVPTLSSLAAVARTAPRHLPTSPRCQRSQPRRRRPLGSRNLRQSPRTIITRPSPSQESLLSPRPSRRAPRSRP